MALKDLRLKELEVDLKIFKVKFAADELSKTLGEILGEMQKITQGLGNDERDILKKIMANPSGALSVENLFPEFRRGTPQHNTLRLLRDAQFIRPVDHRPWRRDSRIEIKAFGELMWRRIGEEKLFGSNNH